MLFHLSGRENDFGNLALLNTKRTLNWSL